MSWVQSIREAGSTAQQSIARAYNQLPADNDAQIWGARCGKMRTLAGYASAVQRLIEHDYLGAFYRALTPSISFAGEFVNGWVGMVNKNRQDKGSSSEYAEHQGELRECALRHPLVPGNGLKFVASAAMSLTGYHSNENSLMWSGALYLGINGLRMTGDRKLLLCSTFLSSSAGATIFYGGICHNNYGDIFVGLFSMLNALFVSRIEPNNLVAR